MVTEKMIEAAFRVFSDRMLMREEDKEFIGRVLEAALSTDAEPVAFTDKDTIEILKRDPLWDGGFITGENHPRRIALYAAPPAPSVAVKALEWNDDPCPAAECAFGHYVINLHYCHAELLFNYGSIMATSIVRLQLERGATVDDIKATAQADYSERIRSALSAQVQDVAGWRYDLEAAPTGLMEFAFTNSIGFCNVRICERMGHQTDSGLQYFYREDGQKADLNSNGWRAYAWRKVDVPPLYPAAPAAKLEGKP